MSSSAGGVVRHAVWLLMLIASPLHAQDSRTITAEQAVETAKNAYGPPTEEKKSKCPAPEPGGPIVVCAELEEQSQFRVKSTEELDPHAVRDIVPRAPDMETHYPGPVVARGCFIPPCPPPMAKIIDLKAIPEAPPGSDADRVAHGLAPRGYDGPPPARAPVAEAPQDKAEGNETAPATPPE